MLKSRESEYLEDTRNIGWKERKHAREECRDEERKEDVKVCEEGPGHTLTE